MTMASATMAAAPVPAPRPNRQARIESVAGCGFSLPAFLLLLLIYILPLLVLGYLSFTNYELGALDTRFLGLANFRKALVDPDPGVQEAALTAIEGLHFPHAFNPLARLYRESTDLRVRESAVRSIGKIQTVEAGEFLVMVLRQEGEALSAVAARALAKLESSDVLPILRQHHEIETNPAVREILGELLKRH